MGGVMWDGVIALARRDAYVEATEQSHRPGHCSHEVPSVSVAQKLRYPPSVGITGKEGCDERAWSCIERKQIIDTKT